MGHTVSRDRNAPDKFEYELWSDMGTIEIRGGFATQPEATRAAEDAQRRVLFGGLIYPAVSLDDALSEMDDDELLRELFS